MPGEERYAKFQDENGVPKVRHVLKEPRLRDSPRERFAKRYSLTASCASAERFFISRRFYFLLQGMYFWYFYEQEVQLQTTAAIFMFFLSSFAILFYYIFSFISRLLIRADAPSDKPPASADLSPAHISALWKYPNVPASPAPILSPPRCRPYAPQRNVSTYAA